MRKAVTMLSAALAVAALACDSSDASRSRSDAGPVTPNDGPEPESATDPVITPIPLDSSPPMVCNGASQLCDQPYDGVVLLATHRSMAVGNPPWDNPTQGRSLTAQLASGGVRAFELEVHSSGGALALCVESCADGNQSFSSALRDVATFLEQNPDDVLTLLLRSRVPARELAAAFDAAGLTAFTHTQAAGTPWPTLKEMIAAGHRLVVFEDDLVVRDGAALPPDGRTGTADADTADASNPDVPVPAWIHRAGEWIQETSPSVGSDCVLTRGTGPMIALNHYLLGATPSEEDLITAHDPTLVAMRLQRCRDDHGRLPMLLVVDFAEIGDPNGGVQIANGLR